MMAILEDDTSLVPAKRNKGPLYVSLFCLTLALIGLMMTANSYNKLNALRIDTEAAASKIETQLQRRYDLIPNLVNTAQAYLDHEKELFTAITEARASVLAAKSEAEKNEANEELMTNLQTLVTLVNENYPQLESDTQMRMLMAQLEGTENRIQVARTDYNAVAKEYNKAITSFPEKLTAGLLGFEKAELYSSEDGAKIRPDVTFK